MFGIEIIKTRNLEALKAEKEKMKEALTDIMGKYENLHRLHDSLWERYKNECQARDKQIEDLQAKVRKLEHDRNTLSKKLRKALK